MICILPRLYEYSSASVSVEEPHFALDKWCHSSSCCECWACSLRAAQWCGPALASVHLQSPKLALQPKVVTSCSSDRLGFLLCLEAFLELRSKLVERLLWVWTNISKKGTLTESRFLGGWPGWSQHVHVSLKET